MGLTLGDNISYKGRKPLDERLLFNTIEEMKDFSENYLPDLAMCQNKEDNKVYCYNVDNTADATTGKWREYGSDKVDKEAGKSLVLDADIAQITTNKNDITTLNADENTAGSVDKKIKDAVGGITSFEYEVVSTLPATGEKGKIYLVPNSGSGENIYDEYIWVGTKFEKIGTTEVDISSKVDKYQGISEAGKSLIVGSDGMVTTGEAGVKVSKETGNQIVEKTDGIYVAETDISGKQDKLTAGDNIDITNDIISAEVPTKTSELTNDSGFLTEHQDISGKADKRYVIHSGEKIGYYKLFTFKNVYECYDDKQGYMDQRAGEITISGEMAIYEYAKPISFKLIFTIWGYSENIHYEFVGGYIEKTPISLDFSIGADYEDWDGSQTSMPRSVYLKVMGRYPGFTIRFTYNVSNKSIYDNLIICDSNEHEEPAEIGDYHNTIIEDNILAYALNNDRVFNFENKQDKLTAGDNITIDSDNKISSVSVSYESKIDNGCLTNKIGELKVGDTTTDVYGVKPSETIFISAATGFNQELTPASVSACASAYRKNMCIKSWSPNTLIEKGTIIYAYSGDFTSIELTGGGYSYYRCNTTHTSSATKLEDADKWDYVSGAVDVVNKVANEKQDKLTAGTNITIDSNNVISATGGSPLSAYPVGSIYMSVNSTSPSTLFGGTWEQIKDTFLIAKGDTYTTAGGSATKTIGSANLPKHTHKYTNTTYSVQGTTLNYAQSGLPPHMHVDWLKNCSGYGLNVSQSAGAHFRNYTETYSSEGQGYDYPTGGGYTTYGVLAGTVNATQSHTHGLSATNNNNNSGDGGFSNTALNIMPPYLPVYMWKRTA